MPHSSRGRRCGVRTVIGTSMCAKRRVKSSMAMWIRMSVGTGIRCARVILTRLRHQSLSKTSLRSTRGRVGGHIHGRQYTKLPLHVTIDIWGAQHRSIGIRIIIFFRDRRWQRLLFVHVGRYRLMYTRLVIEQFRPRTRVVNWWSGFLCSFEFPSTGP